MRTCTGTSEMAVPLTFKSLSQAYDLAVEAAKKDNFRFLKRLFPDAEIDSEREYLLVIDWHLIDWHLIAKQAGVPFGLWASEGVFGKLTIRYSRYVPHGMIYLIENVTCWDKVNGRNLSSPCDY